MKIRIYYEIVIVHIDEFFKVFGILQGFSALDISLIKSKMISIKILTSPSFIILFLIFFSHRKVLGAAWANFLALEPLSHFRKYWCLTIYVNIFSIDWLGMDRSNCHLLDKGGQSLIFYLRSSLKWLSILGL